MIWYSEQRAIICWCACTNFHYRFTQLDRGGANSFPSREFLVRTGFDIEQNGILVSSCRRSQVARTGIFCRCDTCYETHAVQSLNLRLPTGSDTYDGMIQRMKLTTLRDEDTESFGLMLGKLLQQETLSRFGLVDIDEMTCSVSKRFLHLLINDLSEALWNCSLSQAHGREVCNLLLRKRGRNYDAIFYLLRKNLFRITALRNMIWF